jgi:hypothetical protein
MRSCCRAAFLLLVLAVPAHAQAPAASLPKVAVFDFELFDTSLQGETDGPRSDEHDRLLRAGDQIRKGLAESGRYAIVDIAPVNAAAHEKNLQACGGCDVQLAQQLGADLAVTGVVQKVSNLILNMNIYMRNPHPGLHFRRCCASSSVRPTLPTSRSCAALRGREATSITPSISPHASAGDRP